MFLNKHLCLQDQIVKDQNGEYHSTIWSCILHCLCSTIFYQSLFAYCLQLVTTYIHTVHVKVCDCDIPALRLWAENSFVSGSCTFSLSKSLAVDNHCHWSCIFTHSPPPSCRSLLVHFKLFRQAKKRHLIIYQECCTIYGDICLMSFKIINQWETLKTI